MGVASAWVAFAVWRTPHNRPLSAAARNPMASDESDETVGKDIRRMTAADEPLLPVLNASVVGHH